MCQKKEEVKIIELKKEAIVIEPSLKYENMIFVTSSKNKFFIDKYETSNLNEIYLSSPNLMPETNVTQAEAEKICNSMNKRLCTAEEWKVACLGLHYLRYGYSNEHIQGYCNIENPNGEVAISGEYSKCKTENNIYDLLGNTMELTSDKTNSGLVVAKGGDYSSLSATCFTEFYYQAEDRNGKTGFRCCKDEK